MVHGNPSFFRPAEMQGKGVSLSVTPCGLGRPVWRSHPLHPTEETVRVDVWNGEFVGSTKDWAVLPAGEYEAIWLEEKGDVIASQAFDVPARKVFEADFTRSLATGFSTPVHSACTGTWREGENGISAGPGETAYMFIDAAMHGELSGEFSLCDGEGSWGLIARHYNAFAHFRVTLKRDNEGNVTIQLRKYFTPPPDTTKYEVLAEASCRLDAGASHTVCWCLNGRAFDVLINGETLLNVGDDLMGGVTIMGVFCEGPAAAWRNLSMQTTQGVCEHRIDWPGYRAVLRPGNVQHFFLRESSQPEQDLFWESGVQFGHIGGSELKFTQGAWLKQAAAGPVVQRFRWQGPMPKMVERSDDVRGQAWGAGWFYRDRIVIADMVLPWVRRSVGPDFDLFGRLLAGPARIALAGQDEFTDWAMSPDGATTGPSLPANLQAGPIPCSDVFPAAILFPYRLGRETWHLQALVWPLLHSGGDQSAGVFGWVCPNTGEVSHDFRVAPSTPGVANGFAICLTWQGTEDRSAAEQRLLNLRNEWRSPMVIEPNVGGIVEYNGVKEHPAEAIGFGGCFDRASGAYILCARDNSWSGTLQPGGISRETPVLIVRNVAMEATGRLRVQLDGRTLESDKEMYFQILSSDTIAIQLQQALTQSTILELNIQ